MFDIIISQNYSAYELKILLEKITVKSKDFGFHNYLHFSIQVIYFWDFISFCMHQQPYYSRRLTEY